jgi:DNA-directed RNA polymerase specialized sigma24 family protein
MQPAAVLDSDISARIGAVHRAREAHQAGEATTAWELLARASEGDQLAWDHLVERHAGLVWAVARAHGLNLDEAAEASHLTWLLLAQHLGSLRQPDRLGEWLATTARRQAQLLRRLRSHRGVADEPDLAARRRLTPATAAGVPIAEGEAGLWHAVDVLPECCQPLLRLLVVEPPLRDAEIAAALGMPIDRVGRMRARCLDCLRRGTTADGSPERPVGAGWPAAAGCDAQGEEA